MPAWATLAAITLGALAVNVLEPGLVTGTFTDQWLAFACGLFAFVRIWRASGPGRFALDALAALGAVTLARRGQNDLALCLATSLAFIAFHGLDGRVASARAGRALFALGGVSYSLYLTHVPFAIVATGARLALDARVGAVAGDALYLAGAVAFAALFAALFEKPFLNAKPAPAAP